MPRACAASTNALSSSGVPYACLRRERQHAVVAPVARARGLRERHQLDRGDAERDEPVELLRRGRVRASGVNVPTCSS